MWIYSLNKLYKHTGYYSNYFNLSAFWEFS
jgi:hypothetical protein